MAVRTKVNTNRGLFVSFEHASMPTFTKGDRVKFGSDDELLAAVTGPDADSFGFVWEQNGTEVTVLADGIAIVEVKIVSGGAATRGKYAVMSATANQYDDAAAPSGGTTAQVVAGRFMQTGVAGDTVSMMIGGVNNAQVKA